MTNVPVATMISRCQAREGQGYCYGMYFKELVTQEAIHAKAAQYPTVYGTYITFGGNTRTAEVWAEINWIGEFAGDCSGLIKAAYWTDENGDVIYRYQGRGDYSANGMYNAATIKGPLSTMPDTPGLGVHKNGHMGIYVGNGHVIEARGVCYGVVQTDLDLEDLGGSGNPRKWLQWFEIPYVDYTGSTPEPPQPEEIPDIYDLNLVDEGLELGDMVPNSSPQITAMNEFTNVLLATTSDDGVAVAGTYAGLPQQYMMYAAHDPDEIRQVIAAYSTYIGSILGIFLAPRVFIPTADDEAAWINDYDVVGRYDFTMSARPGSLDGYTPKNSKLLYYPYQYLLAHNGDGGRRIYKYEDFNGAPSFKIIAAILPGGTAKLIPVNILKGGDSFIEDYDQALSIACFPECIWTNNEYRAWQSIHGASETISNAGTIGAAAAGIIGGLATGNALVLAGGMGAGIMSIGQMMAKKSEREMMGYTSHGSMSGNQTMEADGRNCFFLITKSIRYMQAKRIDDYFEMFGYKTMEVKTPNTQSRVFWNYLKTVDVSLEGTIPADEKAKLESVYNNGVTIWHVPEYFGDYTQNNHLIAGGGG